MTNRTNGTERVLEVIQEEIQRRNLGPGSKLPTERGLVTLSGQSRATVRNALASLESQGQVVRYVGRGTFLTPALPETGIEISPAESMSVRLLIEPAIIPAIITAARAADFVEMERCLAEGEKATEFEAFEKWDSAFHRSLALATHNPLVVEISDLLIGARLDPEWGHLKRQSFTSERRLEYIQDHRAITAALVKRDGALAQEIMRTHLLRVRTNLLGE